jgi:hypothetical protein
MSELKHWSAEDATADERALLDASRMERPDPKVRARTLAAVGVGASVLATASSASATGGVGALLLKILSVSALVGGVAVGAMVWHARTVTVTPAHPDPPYPPAPALSAPAPIATMVAAPPLADAASSTASSPPPPDADPTPRVKPAAPVTMGETPNPRVPPAPRASSSAVTLADEVAALERAQRALASHDPDAAARELNRYHAKYPQGTLSSEETVLRVQALLARGEDAKAVALANRFAAAHPDSPFAKRVMDLVRSAKKE